MAGWGWLEPVAGNQGPAGSAAAMMASEPFGTNGLREQPRGFRNRNFRIWQNIISSNNCENFGYKTHLGVIWEPLRRESICLTKKHFNSFNLRLLAGTCLIFVFLLSEMGLLVQIATVLSFITAPFYAILNYSLVTSKHMPISDHPNKSMKLLSVLGICFLIGFTLLYLLSL